MQSSPPGWWNMFKVGDSYYNYKPSLYSWWFFTNPFGKICLSNWIISPRFGVKLKNLWVATTETFISHWHPGSPRRRPLWLWIHGIFIQQNGGTATFILGGFRRKPTVSSTRAGEWSVLHHPTYFAMETSWESGWIFQYMVGTNPHAVAVTTRIITFLVGNPYKSSFVSVTWWGVDRTYTFEVSSSPTT